MNGGPEISLAEVVAATGGEVAYVPRADGVIFRGITTDSRQCGAGNLFVALAGTSFDGHDYLEQARRQGAAGLLIHRWPASLPGDIPVITVADTLTALGDLAHYWRRRFSPTVIAVTGSTGKTTTKEMIAAILARRGQILKTEGNLNNLIGLPHTLFRLRPGDTAAVLELGTNRRGEIARLAQIAVPDIALITNIGPAHLEGFVDMAGVAAEKMDLFSNTPATGTLIVNRDDPFLRDAGRDRPGRSLSFGLDPEADVRAAGITTVVIPPSAAIPGIPPAIPRLETRFILRIGEGQQEITMPVAGEHQIINALAAAASAWAAGAAEEDIGRGLAGFVPVPGRTEIIPLEGGAFVVNDAYNANPASVRAALTTLRQLKGRGRGVAVLGDMLELGAQEAAWHEEIGGLLADSGVERVYLRGRLSGATAAGASKHGLPAGAIIIEEDPEAIARDLRSWLREGDWVLVKGSRRLRMDLVTTALCRSGASEGGAR